jgi:hypothetical protein
MWTSWLLVAWIGTASAAAPSETQLTARIDHHLAAGWSKVGLTPAPVADDATYLRRVYLDLIGRIPTATEARRFLDDRSADKRAALVRELLGRPAQVDHWVNLWNDWLLPENDENGQRQDDTFRAWLRERLKPGVGYDKLVRDLLGMPLGVERVRGQRGMMRPNAAGMAGNEPTPLAFYLAKEVKPENLAAATARLFLGVRIECAQCHNHPFANWTREQFWSYAAFFAGLSREQGNGNAVRELFDKRELLIPGGNQVAEPRFLALDDDGAEPNWRPNVGTRATLAEWLTGPTNPFFARAAVNRLWAQCFGTGLIDPIDDFRPENPASHPELLDELAAAFVASQFDAHYLLRAILASRAYQASSASASSPPEPRWFAVKQLKPLTPDQLYDSFDTALGIAPPFVGPLAPNAVPPDDQRGLRQEFLARFRTGGATEARLSIPQALTLMNGRISATARTRPMFARLRELPASTQVEELFLTTLARRPTATEAARVQRWLDAGANTEHALADVLWALLNSVEFRVNH